MRDQSIDALKGLAIILVVIGHAIITASAVAHGAPGLVKVDTTSWVPFATAMNPLLSFVYSFEMPLFAFASGLVMWPPRGYGIAGHLVRRARGLLVPYLAWFVILFLLVGIQQPNQGFGAALGSAVIGRGGLWYLYALFLCVAVVVCLERIPGSRWILAGSALLAVAISTGLFFRIPTVLYLGNVTWIYPFVVLGYLVSPLKTWVQEHRYLAAVAFAAFIPLFYLRSPVFVSGIQPIGHVAVAMNAAGIRGGFTLSIVLPYACALAAVLALYGVYSGRSGALIQAHAWVGRKSLGVYAMHGPIIWWLVWSGVRNAFLLTLIALVASAALTAVLERTPVLSSILLGQNPAKPSRAIRLSALERSQQDAGSRDLEAS